MRKLRIESGVKPVAAGTLNGEVIILYRETGDDDYGLRAAKTDSGGTKLTTERQKFAVLYRGRKENITRIKNARLYESDDETFLTYERVVADRPKTFIARLINGREFEVEAVVPFLGNPGLFVPGGGFSKTNIYYFGLDTITSARSEDLKQWDKTNALIISPRPGFFDREPLRIAGGLVIKNEILIIYCGQSGWNDKTETSVGAALINRREPSKVVWRSETPLWKFTESGFWKILGAGVTKNKIQLFLLSSDGKMETVIIPAELTKLDYLKPKNSPLKRHESNPILEPVAEHDWENEATFNPAALSFGGQVHLLYRAVGKDGISQLGHAASPDGVNFNERSFRPIYRPVSGLDKKRAAKIKAEARYDPAVL